MARKKIYFFSADETYHVFRRIAKKLQMKDFIQAESFGARDKICRVFAAECFELAKRFAEQGEDKLSLQYTKLAAKLLGQSFRPKKLAYIEEIKKALADLKNQDAQGLGADEN